MEEKHSTEEKHSMEEKHSTEEKHSMEETHSTEENISTETQRFQVLLNKKTEAIEEILRRYLPKEQGYQKTVLQAMNYSLMAGGKRLRSMLMQETYRMFGGHTEDVHSMEEAHSGREIEPFMAAIEMIHTYSLVHDDLPAMDNDEYRRGRKTVHVVYGEGMAILAGDALLNYAFETALRAFPLKQDMAEEKISVCKMQAIGRALHILAVKSGIYGMIGGQTADMEAEVQTEPITEEQLLFIHGHKTAALIQAAMMVGAILAGASEAEIELIEKCAYHIGIAFQIQDDILDVTGSSTQLGKQVGSDTRNQKQTYVTINGLEKAQEDVRKLSQEAVRILEDFPGEHEFLIQLVTALIHRSK